MSKKNCGQPFFAAKWRDNQMISRYCDSLAVTIVLVLEFECGAWKAIFGLDAVNNTQCVDSKEYEPWRARVPAHTAVNCHGIFVDELFSHPRGDGKK